MYIKQPWPEFFSIMLCLKPDDLGRDGKLTIKAGLKIFNFSLKQKKKILNVSTI